MNIAISGPFEHRHGKITSFDHGTSYPVATVTTSSKITAEGKQALGDLIAAAPELLAALEMAYAVMTSARVEVYNHDRANYSRIENAIDSARAAIARATGKGV